MDSMLRKRVRRRKNGLNDFFDLGSQRGVTLSCKDIKAAPRLPRAQIRTDIPKLKILPLNGYAGSGMQFAVPIDNNLEPWENSYTYFFTPNHASVNLWIGSAIRGSSQPTSRIPFVFLRPYWYAVLHGAHFAKTNYSLGLRSCNCKQLPQFAASHLLKANMESPGVSGLGINHPANVLGCNSPKTTKISAESARNEIYCSC